MTNKAQNSKIFKVVCLTSLIVGFVYSIVLLFSWGNNPLDELGTLSLLCENRKIFFWIWVIVDGGALFLNLNYMYNKYGNAGKFIRTLPYLMLLCEVCIALTLGHSIDSWNPKRVAHWVATGLSVAVLCASMLLYAIINIKKGKVFVYIAISEVLILILFLAWFIILGKSGLLEMVPHALYEILLFAFNFVVCEKKKIPEKV